MLPYQTLQEAELALGRDLTYLESLWFHYSSQKSDYFLFCHNILFLFLVFSLVPLPLVFMELKKSKSIEKFKLQPKVKIPEHDMIKCYKDVMKMFFLVVGPLQLVSYPTVKWVGIRTSLPLPSGWEIVLQLLVYFIVEDYANYWIHRLLHGKWGYEKIHKVHHEFSAPIGFAAPYAHWAEVLILGIPSFMGPAIVPGHMVTFWLWIVLRQIEAIETHSGGHPIEGSTFYRCIRIYRSEKYVACYIFRRQWVGIRTSLPFPSGWEIVLQLLVYFTVEDYGNYWIHRLLHSEWGYEKIHKVHHEFSAPIALAAPYAHWAEVLLLGIPSFMGPAIVPGHMVTFWLWIVLRQIEAIETHSGYDFPWTPTKYIPFYGGAEYHDYHHYVGGQSQSNFASVFTYCDYIYGTDKGYRYQKQHLGKLREKWSSNEQNGDAYLKTDDLKSE